MLILSFGVLTALTELSLRFLMLRFQRLWSWRCVILTSGWQGVEHRRCQCSARAWRDKKQTNNQTNKQAKNIPDKNSANLIRQCLTHWTYVAGSPVLNTWPHWKDQKFKYMELFQRVAWNVFQLFSVSLSHILCLLLSRISTVSSGQPSVREFPISISTCYLESLFRLLSLFSCGFFK